MMIFKWLNRFPQTQSSLNRDRVILLIILFIWACVYEIVHFWPGILGLGKPGVFEAIPIDMEIEETTLWDNHATKHGYNMNQQHQQSNHLNTEDSKSYLQKMTPDSKRTCDGFFALWPSDCVDKYADLNMKLKVLHAQMKTMNSTLTLYVTDMKMCSFDLYESHIIIEKFNPTDLLIEYGFEPTFAIMDTWPKNRYTRISDILRLALASKYSKSYIDTDVTFLNLQKYLYEKTYVGSAIWSNSKNAIEITNGAFCLPNNILSDMMSYQKNRILHGSDKYFYTELGPSMFHNVLMNRHEIMMYSQNNPAEPSLDEIARAIHQYGHMHLHLTGHVRKGNKDLNFGEIVNTIRRKAGLPLLEYIEEDTPNQNE
jgi:hypothetical protein